MWTDIPRVSDALQVLQDPVTAGTAEKELMAQEGLGTGKGIPKAGTSGFVRGGRAGGDGGGQEPQETKCLSPQAPGAFPHAESCSLRLP